mmetsp:Transcript_51311/g.160223  ORF Transcript_51311/g.160223 Transcript_51311/m.160223 type:complete len:550 (+) Transcript_51311:74-1723(+)
MGKYRQVKERAKLQQKKERNKRLAEEGKFSSDDEEVAGNSGLVLLKYMKKDSQEEAIIAEFQHVLQQPVDLPSHEGPSLRSFTENLDFAPWKVEADFEQEAARIASQAAEKVEQKVAHTLNKIQLESSEVILSHLHIHDPQVPSILQHVKRATSLTKLDMSMNAIGSEGASGLGAFLQTCSTLVSLNLKGNKLRNDGVRELLTANFDHPTLRELVLDSNGIGPAFPECLGRMTSLRLLSLRNNSCSDFPVHLLELIERVDLHGNADLDRLLMDALEEQERELERAAGRASLIKGIEQAEELLKEKDFEAAMVCLARARKQAGEEAGEPELLRRLEEVEEEARDMQKSLGGQRKAASHEDLMLRVTLHTAMQRIRTGASFLSLRGSRVSDSDVQTLTQAMQGDHCRVSQLDLSQNELSSAGVEKLRSVLGHDSIIERLWLGGNKLHDTGATRLAEVLQGNESLVALDVSSNQLGPDGCLRIAHALMYNPMLRELDLSDNQLGDEASGEISRYLGRLRNLQVVNVASCGLSAAGVLGFMAALQENGTLVRC